MGVSFAFIKDDKPYVVTDSLHAGVFDKGSYSIAENYKLWNVRGAESILMTYQGHGTKHFSDILKMKNDLIDKQQIQNGVLSLSYVIKILVPKLFQYAKDYKIIDGNKTSEGLPGEIMLITPKQIIRISNSANVELTEDFAAIGLVDEFAYGAYSAIDKNQSPLDLSISLMSAIEEHAVHVRFPVLFGDINKKEYKIIKQNISLVEKTIK